MMHGGYSDGEIIHEGETIINGPIGSGTMSEQANPRIMTQPRVARKRSLVKQIFQPRRVNGPNKPLAY